MKPKFAVCALICLTPAILTPVSAGPYAKLAASVQANGGVLQLTAMGGLETQSAATLTAVAISECHTIATEGVIVTAVQIMSQSGQLILLVNAPTLSGC